MVFAHHVILTKAMVLVARRVMKAVVSIAQMDTTSQKMANRASHMKDQIFRCQAYLSNVNQVSMHPDLNV